MAIADVETIVHECGHIGHGAILHGCIIGRDALVGMNSVIMDLVLSSANKALLLR